MLPQLIVLAFDARHVKPSPRLLSGLLASDAISSLKPKLRDHRHQFTNRDFSSRTKIHRIGLVVTFGREDPLAPARAICN